MKVSSAKKIYITGGVTATDVNGHVFSASYLAKFNIVFGNVLSLAYEAPKLGEFTYNLKGTGLSLDYGKTDVYWMCDNWNDNTTHAQEFAQLYDMDATAPLRQAAPTYSMADVNVYPNPATDKINVHANENITSIDITDLTGQLVKSETIITEANADVNISGIRQGLYICKVTTQSGAITLKKLMIQ